MKPFRKLFLYFAAVLLVAPGLKAQQPPPPPPAPDPAMQEHRKAAMKEIFAQLGLTDDQIQQIKEIRQGDGLPKEKFQKVLAVLTPDQKQKFKEMMQAKMAEFRQQQQANGNSGNNTPSNNQTPSTPPATTTPTNAPKLAPYNPAPVQPLDL